MKNLRCIVVTFFGSCVCLGCSDTGDPLGPVANITEAARIRHALGGSEEGGPSVAAAADTGSGWATLTGRFVFDGTPPPPRPKQGVNIKPEEQAICAPNGPPLEDSLIVGGGGGLQYVAIYLRSAPRVHEAAQATPQEPFVFDQKSCVFQSHVFGCQVGQTVILKNSDAVGHNAKIEGKAQFNQTIQANDALNFVFQVEEAAPQPVSCSIHPWMRAYALPRDNGYYAVTGPDGSFSIPNLPAGVELEFQVWHERGTGTGNGLALDTPEAKELQWNSRGRFKIMLQENENREMIITVPPSALGV
jgi:plastocyanin